MLIQAMALKKLAEVFFTKGYSFIAANRDAVTAMTQEDRADAVFVLRKTREQIKSLSTELEVLEQKLIDVTCLVWVTSMNNEPVRGNLCTGTPDIKEAPVIPSRKTEPELYSKMLTDLGVVDSEVVSSDAVRPHWPGLMEMVSNRIAAGRKKPEWVRETRPQYKLTVREKSAR